MGDIMKGFVLRIGNKTGAVRLPRIKRPQLSVREMISRYGLRSIFVILFILGLILGAVCSRSFDSGLFERLDFLFISNIEARLAMTSFDIFLSCFVSYFLFIFLLFLFSLSAWGFMTAPALSVFKGFSVGLSSAFIFAAYKASGIGFFILTVLPGAALFLFALVRYSCVCFRLSLDYARLTVFGYEDASALRGRLRRSVSSSLTAFIISSGCAVLDTLMWTLFAGRFHF